MNYQGRAKGREYVPAPPNWTTKERLEELERIADRIEEGRATPIELLAVEAHKTALMRDHPLGLTSYDVEDLDE